MPLPVPRGRSALQGGTLAVAPSLRSPTHAGGAGARPCPYRFHADVRLGRALRWRRPWISVVAVSLMKQAQGHAPTGSTRTFGIAGGYPRGRPVLAVAHPRGWGRRKAMPLPVPRGRSARKGVALAEALDLGGRRLVDEAGARPCPYRFHADVRHCRGVPSRSPRPCGRPPTRVGQAQGHAPTGSTRTF